MVSFRPGPALGLAFALGIAWVALPLAPPPLSASLLRWIVAGLLALLVVTAIERPRRRGAGALVVLFVLGALRGTASSLGISPTKVALPPGPVEVIAWVDDVPVVEQLELPGVRDDAAPAVRLRFSTSEPSWNVIVDAANAVDLPSVPPGAWVRMRGRAVERIAWRNPGSLRSTGRERPILKVPRPQLVDVLRLDPFHRPIDGPALLLRDRCRALLATLFEEPVRSFLIAMLLGDRRGLEPAIRESLLLTGTIHFLAISGLNVALAMALVVRTPLPRSLRLPLRLGFLVTITFLTGAAPPVARAAVMLGMHMAGEAAGRAPRALDTLGWSALILLAIEPAWVIDPGFLLSVAAVFGLLAWTPILEGRPEDPRVARLVAIAVQERPRGRVVRLASHALIAAKRSLSISIASTIGTTPVVLALFQRVHPLGPIWNLIVGPVVLVILLSAGAALLLASIHPAIAAPAAWIADGASRILFTLLERLASVPGSTIAVCSPPSWVIGCVEVLLVLGAIAITRRPAVVVAAVLSLALVASSTLGPQSPTLHVLDVGGGSCALLRLPRDGAYLFDCGGRRSHQGGERIARALLTLGVRRVDGVFLSHAHDDHTSALLGLSRRLAIERVWATPFFARSTSGARLLDALEKAGVRCAVLSAGEVIQSGGLRVLALQPAHDERLRFVDDANEGSLVLAVEAAGRRILMPGDIEELGTTRLLAGGHALEADILVVPHHGRTNRLLDRLIERVAPRVALISGDGAGGGESTLERLRERDGHAAATWERGAIGVTLDALEISVAEK